MSGKLPKDESKLDPLKSPSLKNWGRPPQQEELRISRKNVYINCGWGRLIFAHTYDENHNIANLIRGEEQKKRDIAFYIRDPHVALAQSPQELFLDPSHTYRFWMSENDIFYPPCQGFTIRVCDPEKDLDAINRIYKTHGMVPISKRFLENNEQQDTITYFVAVDDKSNNIIGVVMGADHVKVFDDPENGSSLWALAVDSQARVPGVGVALTQHLIHFYHQRGRSFMDLSVLHSNQSANQMYEKIGFCRVPVFCLKRKNAINEKLFAGPEVKENLNPYSEIIINEARLRGISVDIIDEENNYFALSFGGRSITCRESLTELTSAIAMSRCADKSVTHKLVDEVGIRVPRQKVASDQDENESFLYQCKSLAVKPADNEQGRGISLNITTNDKLKSAIDIARQYSEKVVLEECVEGIDLRLIVINYNVVAAAIRKPPEIIGDGSHTIDELIRKQSRRRSAATHGESSIPLDNETRHCIDSQGFQLSDVPDTGQLIKVRRTANLHTGGTIHDVTPLLHPDLRAAAIVVAETLEIPVVGVDFMVTSPDAPEYHFIEANERPGLANHEPQPTAQKFIDFLFPNTLPIKGQRP